MHTTTTKAKISIKQRKNKNAEKYNYYYAFNLFVDAIHEAQENDYFIINQVAQALNVPKKRFMYLAKKYPQLKGAYLYLLQTLEVNVYELCNANKMPVKLAVFLLGYAYGYYKKIKENQRQRKELDTSNVSNLICFV